MFGLCIDSYASYCLNPGSCSWRMCANKFPKTTIHTSFCDKKNNRRLLGYQWYCSRVNLFVLHITSHHTRYPLLIVDIRIESKFCDVLLFCHSKICGFGDHVRTMYWFHCFLSLKPRILQLTYLRYNTFYLSRSIMFVPSQKLCISAKIVLGCYGNKMTQPWCW